MNFLIVLMSLTSVLIGQSQGGYQIGGMQSRMYCSRITDSLHCICNELSPNADRNQRCINFKNEILAESRRRVYLTEVAPRSGRGRRSAILNAFQLDDPNTLSKNDPESQNIGKEDNGNQLVRQKRHSTDYIYASDICCNSTTNYRCNRSDIQPFCTASAK